MEITHLILVVITLIICQEGDLVSIDREYIKKKVKQAIEQLPSSGIVVREVINKYNEKVGYCRVSNLTGVLYNNTTNRTFGIKLEDIGVDSDSNNKNYMVVYDESSKVVKLTDIIFIDNTVYKVSDPGENLKIYCLMKLEEYHTLRIEGDNVIEDDLIYPLMDLPLHLDLRFGD